MLLRAGTISVSLTIIFPIPIAKQHLIHSECSAKNCRLNGNQRDSLCWKGLMRARICKEYIVFFVLVLYQCTNVLVPNVLVLFLGGLFN